MADEFPVPTDPDLFAGGDVVDPSALGDFLSDNAGVDRDGNPCGAYGYGCYPTDMEGADSQGRWDADFLDQEAAGLIREQWDQYKQMYTPIMQNLNQMVGDKGAADEQAQISRGRGLAAGVSAEAQGRRDVDRYGIGMTKNQRSQFETGMDLSTTAGGVQASNRSRMSMYNHRLAVMSDMAAAGHGVQGSAMSGLNTAVANANQTATNLQGQVAGAQQAKSDRNAQIAGTVMSVAAMALL